MAVIDAQGTTLTVYDGVSAQTTVGGVVSFSLADGEASDIDVTTLASTAKEYQQGLQDFGEFTFELIRDLDNAGQAELLEMKAAQEIREFVITFPAGTLNVGTFDGYVKSLNIDGGVDEVLRGTCTVKIDGAIAWT